MLCFACSACVLHVFCVCSACVLRVFCVCSACVLRVFCVCSACVLREQVLLFGDLSVVIRLYALVFSNSLNLALEVHVKICLWM